MTMATCAFNVHKRNGNVKKAGMAWFFNGNREMKRVLWYDEELNKNFVVVNGDVWDFKAYSVQDVVGVVKGHI